MPMVMEFGYNKDGSLKNITFSGLNGNEFTGNVKSALELLKIENPACAFKDRVKAGEFDAMMDDEYNQIFNEVNFVSSLWHYPDAKEGEARQGEMNVLMLLANAIEAASRQHAIISREDIGCEGMDGGESCSLL